MKTTLLFAASSMLALTATSSAVSLVQGGSTSVLLDVALLDNAAGLALSSRSADVTPGALGAGSVAFSINAPDAAVLPTTFSYTAASLAPFAGEINHTGSVFFNADAVQVGDFRIGFDSGRVVGVNSGFFVESTAGVAAILFDLANVTTDTVEPLSLIVSGDLAVSPEFAGFLGDLNLTGADVGDAQINAQAIPEPSSLLATALAALVFVGRRRRS